MITLIIDMEDLLLSVASAGVQKRWNMKREYSSKIDTADFYSLFANQVHNRQDHEIFGLLNQNLQIRKIKCIF